MLISTQACQDKALAGILYTVKNVLLIIQLAVPIILIVFATYGLFKMMTDPDDKKSKKKIINMFIAAIVVFLIPAMVNGTMAIIGDNSKFSSCWNNAKKITGNSQYIPIDYNENRQNIVSSDD